MARLQLTPLDFPVLAGTPAAPSANTVRLYARSADSHVVQLDDTGRVTDLAGAPIPDPSGMVLIEDDLNNDSIAADEMGTLGWSSTGTITFINSVAGHPGIRRVATSTVSGNIASMRLGGSSTIVVFPTEVERHVWVVRPIDITNVELRVGLFSNIGAGDGGADAAGFKFEPATNANWLTWTRASSTGTSNATDVAVTTNNWYQLEARRLVSNGNWEFYLNGQLKFTHSTNLPTVGVSVGAIVETLEAVAKSLDLDYFAMRYMTGQRWT